MVPPTSRPGKTESRQIGAPSGRSHRSPLSMQHARFLHTPSLQTRLALPTHQRCSSASSTDLLIQCKRDGTAAAGIALLSAHERLSRTEGAVDGSTSTSIARCSRTEGMLCEAHAAKAPAGEARSKDDLNLPLPIAARGTLKSEVSARRSAVSRARCGGVQRKSLKSIFSAKSVPAVASAPRKGPGMAARPAETTKARRRRVAFVLLR